MAKRIARQVRRTVDNQFSSVVHCVNEVLLEHRDWPPVNDAAVMADDYQYQFPSMELFLAAVQKKLGNARYLFQYNRALVTACLTSTVIAVKYKVNQNTKPVK